jgi:ABC-type phosphate transport system substrate-binding protein
MKQVTTYSHAVIGTIGLLLLMMLPNLALSQTQTPAQTQTQTQAQAQAQSQTTSPERDALVLIGHASLPRIDIATAQRLYTGRAVEVAGVAVLPVNAATGSKARERFMAGVMNQEDDKYVAYWTVRKHVGKGTPPRELKTATEVIDFVQNTPGALGYVVAGDLKPGMNVVLRP